MSATVVYRRQYGRGFKVRVYLFITYIISNFATRPNLWCAVTNVSALFAFGVLS